MRRAVVGVPAGAVEANYAELTARLRQPGAVIANVFEPFSDAQSSQPSRDASASFAEALQSLVRNHSTPAAHGEVLSDDSDRERRAAHVVAAVFEHLAPRRAHGSLRGVQLNLRARP